MLPEDPRHGTEAGHSAHERDNEDPCGPCYDADLRAHRRRRKLSQMGATYRLPVGTRIFTKLTGYREAGYTQEQIATAAGIEQSQVSTILRGGPDRRIKTATYNKLATMRAPRGVTFVGVTRRLQALAAIGYTLDRLATETGVSFANLKRLRAAPPTQMSPRVADQISEAYERLSATPLPDSGPRYERMGVSRARSDARRKGWVSPLGWDSIDDAREKPTGTRRAWHTGPSHSSVDHAVVERLLAGETIDSTKAERVEATRRWLASGRPANTLNAIHGWHDGRYAQGKDAA